MGTGITGFIFPANNNKVLSCDPNMRVFLYIYNKSILKNIFFGLFCGLNLEPFFDSTSTQHGWKDALHQSSFLLLWLLHLLLLIVWVVITATSTTVCIITILDTATLILSYCCQFCCCRCRRRPLRRCRCRRCRCGCLCRCLFGSSGRCCCCCCCCCCWRCWFWLSQLLFFGSLWFCSCPCLWFYQLVVSLLRWLHPARWGGMVTAQTKRD